MLSKNNRQVAWLTAAIILLTIPQIPLVNASPDSIRRETFTIELEDGITTEAQLTYPVTGEGPYPAVLLVPGGGLTDMDEYIPASLTTTGKPASPMKQIAEYLSERGYVVLRYDKRGVARNATMVNYTLYSHATVETFKEDAEAALTVLKSNQMVDQEDITVLGHSESSIIVTRMAQDDPAIDKVVMLGAAARGYLDIKYTQIIELRIEFAEKVMDIDGNGLVTIDEAITSMEPYVNAILPKSSVLMTVGNETVWIPTWDPNGDGNMSIEEEFKPVLERVFLLLSDPGYQGYNQTMAHVSWGATMDIIGDLEASVLVLQGEADFQTPFIEALLLEQALVEAGHPDHTLSTYPGLSHFFHPSDGWQAAMGPIEPYVLNDLYQWLNSPTRIIDDIRVTGVENSEAVESLAESVNDSLSEIQVRMDEVDRGESGYVIPVMIVMLVLVLATLRWKR